MAVTPSIKKQLTRYAKTHEAEREMPCTQYTKQCPFAAFASAMKRTWTCTNSLVLCPLF